MASTREKVRALTAALADIETVRVMDVTTMGHPDPSKCDIGFWVWIQGVDRSTAEAVARVGVVE